MHVQIDPSTQLSVPSPRTWCATNPRLCALDHTVARACISTSSLRRAAPCSSTRIPRIRRCRRPPLRPTRCSSSYWRRPSRSTTSFRFQSFHYSATAGAHAIGTAAHAGLHLFAASSRPQRLRTQGYIVWLPLFSHGLAQTHLEQTSTPLYIAQTTLHLRQEKDRKFVLGELQDALES